MAYQSRKRNYKTAQERYKQDKYKAKVIFVIFTLAALVWMFKERYEIWYWLKSLYY